MLTVLAGVLNAVSLINFFQTQSQSSERFSNLPQDTQPGRAIGSFTENLGGEMVTKPVMLRVVRRGCLETRPSPHPDSAKHSFSV